MKEDARVRQVGYNFFKETRTLYMPWRTFLSEEMADLLRALSHPHRIRIIHELRNGPMDVNGLQNVLGISHARVSQYLSALKQHHIVKERRDGRHVYYSLKAEGIAQWLHNGMQFLGSGIEHQSAVEAALRQSTEVWGAPRPLHPTVPQSDSDDLR